MARKRRKAKGNKSEQKPGIGGTAFTDNAEQESVKAADTPKAEGKKSKPKSSVSKPTGRKAPTSSQKMGSFFKDVRAEMKKVSWPDQERTAQSTGVVIVTLIFLAGCMTLFTIICTFFADYLFGQ